MKKLAFVFPGQGSQYVGMGMEFYRNRPLARHFFELANEALGLDIARACFEGPEDKLKMTPITQPALLVCSYIANQLLREAGIRPAYVAGHSLGEYSALLAAGGISFFDAVRLVRKRGELMQEAVPLGKGGMAAILGLEREEVFRVCEEAQDGQVVEVANLNAPGQVVISGEKEAVERAMEIARNRGAKKVVPLQVSAPFHCALMNTVRDRLAEILLRLPMEDPEIPLVANVDARPVFSAAEARSALIRQTNSPVRWEESVRFLHQEGVDLFVEVGPGKVLSGLIKRTVEGASVVNVEDERSLQSTLEFLRRDG